MTQSLTPLIFNLGPTELIIILVIVLLLFGGSRLAGLGKSTGRALKEFKEETKGLRESDKDKTKEASEPTTMQPPAAQQPFVAPPQQISNQQPGQAPTGQPPTGQTWQQPPANNLADPSSNDVRRDV